MHEEKETKQKEADTVKDGAVPAYLLERQNVSRAKVSLALSSPPLSPVLGSLQQHQAEASRASWKVERPPPQGPTHLGG